MADMLSHNSTLTELNVSQCGLTPQSCVSMFNALKHNSSLKKLDISKTTFDQAASEALADMLSHNSTLTELKVSLCGRPTGDSGWLHGGGGGGGRRGRRTGTCKKGVSVSHTEENKF